MPVKIIPKDKLNSAEGVTKEQIKNMAEKYRGRRLGKFLKWSHFEVSEILELMRDNGVFQGADTVDSIIARETDDEATTKHGIKIILGKHDKKTIPTSRADYDKRVTTILCTTKKEKGTNKWKNDLEEFVHKVSGLADNKGMGLDKTLICEPDCESGDDVI